ncbi:MAG TPA: hypothetical protein VFE39_00935 [Pseudonocardia sp.]|nr:hypothetical protein [Pseudonocardia sp.]
MTNSAARIYPKVPNWWRPIHARGADDAIGLDPSLIESQRGFWLAGYDADARPSPAHMLGPHSPAPAAFIGVRTSRLWLVARSRST